MPRRRRRLPTAFINLAYVDSNETLYLALIAGLAGFGLVPVAALHDPTTNPQLTRIYALIEESIISFHDLSYVKLDRPAPLTPRFNMPFELGLAVAVAVGSRRRHRWFVLEKKQHRAAKSLSDISGANIQLHDGRAPAVLRAISNALARHNPSPTLKQLQAIYGDVRKKARALKNIDGWSSVFLQAPFKDLRLLASISASTHIPGLKPFMGAGATPRRRSGRGRQP